MKRALIIVLGLALPLTASSQGTFILGNETAPTRVGSADGPLAGSEVWAQGLAGFTANSLTPVGVPISHHEGLLSYFPTIFVPWAGISETILVRMVAWDTTAWGTDLSGVPLNQRGYTDLVSIILVSPSSPQEITQFTQAAIVPVPEPSALTLVGLGSAALLAFRKRSAARVDR